MRNIEKHPNNAYNITIYLNKEDRERLNMLSQLSGLSCGKVLAKKTYVVRELTFE